MALTQATLNGAIDPNGIPTDGRFQYGKSQDYGSLTALQSVGSGQGNVQLNQPVTGLGCSTLYHFRAEAQSTGGTAYGVDWTFLTDACPKGDVNGDASVTVSDVLYLVNHLFAGGAAPIGQTGDVNADGSVNVSDVLYLVNYLFAGGPAPK